jgi:hypothetical protein
MNNEITLGMKVTDKVTGYSGIVTCVAQYLDATSRAAVDALVEGKATTQWFDLTRLVETTSTEGGV